MRSLSRSLLVLCLLTVTSQTAWAGCPRTRWELTRRITSSILWWPAAPFILLSSSERAVPLPASGTAVRISHRRDGRTAFARGAFLDTTAAAVRLQTDRGDTVAIPLASLSCLQVARRSHAQGAGAGFLTGVTVGAATGALVGLTASAPDRAEAMVFGVGSLSFLGAILGPVIGGIRGGTIWDTAIERPR